MTRYLATTAIAVMMFVGALPAASAEQYQGQPGQGQYQNHDSHQNDAHQNDAHQSGPSGYRDSRHRWRDNRADARWDDSQHNGYYADGRFYHGPPPQDRYGQRGFALGYQPWARGQRLGYYGNRYHEVSYREHHLRRPQRGYHWVQSDRGDFLLAAIASGVIAQVILSNGR